VVLVADWAFRKVLIWTGLLATLETVLQEQEMDQALHPKSRLA
jgi:hypothetical protein